MVNVMYLPFASSSGISTAKYVHVSKLNKRFFFTLPSGNCRPFASEVVF